MRTRTVVAIVWSTAACGGAPPSLKTGMMTIEKGVQETTPVTLSDLDPIVVAAWRSKHPAPVGPPQSADDLSPHERIVQQIRWGQCQSHTANPLLPVVSGAFSMALQGNFTSGASATGGGGPTGPTASGTLTFTISQQQTVTVPVTFVTAANMGNFYASQMLALFTNTTAVSSWLPPGATAWPAPAPPSPAIPGTANAQMAIGPISPPAAPDSQMARLQASLERVIQTRDAIDAAAKEAFSKYPPAAADTFCTQYAKDGFVPVTFPLAM